MASRVDLGSAETLLVDTSGADPLDVARSQRASWVGGALVAITGLALVLINPRGYIGGGWDDAHYLDAIIAWSENGPQVGTLHWSLRWPLLLSNIAAVELFGLGRTVLMVPAVLTYLGLGLALYLIVGRLAGWRAGTIAGFTVVTIPELARWSTVIYPDSFEALLWLVSLGCFWRGSDSEKQNRRAWLVACGVAAGLAWSLRETALGLWVAYGIAFLLAYRMPRAQYGWIALTAIAVPLIEYGIYWQLTGDPLYRLHIDMRHVEVPSSDLTGKVAIGFNPLLNPTLMARWIGAGPVHLHWTIDPYLNLFTDFLGGLVFNILALVGVVLLIARRNGVRESLGSSRALCQALLVVIAANILVNLYILSVRPGPRMFLPALVAGSALIGIAYVRLNAPWLRNTIGILLTAKLLVTAVIVDTAPNFTQAASAGERLVKSVADPIHINKVTNLHIRLAPQEFRERLTLGEVPVGGHYLAVGTPRTLEQPDQGAPNPAYGWALVSRTDTGQMPWTVRLLSVPIQGMGFMKDYRYQAVEARLYQRTS